MADGLHPAIRRGDKDRVLELLGDPAAGQIVNEPDGDGNTPLMLALDCAGTASPATTIAIVAALLGHGADAAYRKQGGYDALINAVHSCHGFADAQMIDLLGRLIAHGAPLDGKSDWSETAVRVLSRTGRFALVEYLLHAGAKPDDVQYTPLIETVLFGSMVRIAEALRAKPDLEGRDYWERTAFLCAVQLGSIEKAQILLDAGADIGALGRCAKPALLYAAEQGDVAMVQWLLGLGVPVDVVDRFGATALRASLLSGDADTIRALIAAGADVNSSSPSGSILGNASTRDAAMLLLEAGADPQQLSREGIRAILGFGPEPDPAALDVGEAEFQRGRVRRFGTKNPQETEQPFWQAMIRSGLSSYGAAKIYIGEDRKCAPDHQPIWSADRFGQSLTFLPDGRIVQIGGEHEDHYDPDFCIYNDVFVHAPGGGGAVIYSYPEADFPPTDFHTATLIGNDIFVIGSLGYPGKRLYGQTPAYRLNTTSFVIERLETSGLMPGWIYGHRADANEGRIRIRGGKILTRSGDQEDMTGNESVFILDTASGNWTRGG